MPDPLKSICDCSECRSNEKRKRGLRGAVRQRKFLQRILPLLGLWALLAYLSYGLVTNPPAAGMTIYNPFEILDISSSSTEKEIKKRYRKLSLEL